MEVRRTEADKRPSDGSSQAAVFSSHFSVELCLLGSEFRMSFNRSWRELKKRSQVTPKRRQQGQFASRGRIARFEAFEPRMMLAYSPLQIQTAYGFNEMTYGSIVGNGAGQTIAIINAGDDPNLVNSTDPNFSKSDLAKFDADYGLPNPPSFKVIGENGGARPTYANAADNPADDSEIAADVEWSHAMAPGANIVLIETTDTPASNLAAALQEAVPASGATVVSMSFGGLEDDAETGTTPSESVSILSASESGNTVTIHTAAPLAVGVDSAVTISGASIAGYDESTEVASVNSAGTMFTYTDPNTHLGASTGGTTTLPLYNDSDFMLPGVTYLASSGDRGAPGLYPADSPDVVSVGATNLEASSTGTYIAETGWSNPSNILTATETGNVVTITTQNTIGPLVGNDVSIANVGLSSYDGDFLISNVISPTEFSYTDTQFSNLGSSTGGAAAAGAFSAGGLINQLSPPAQVIDDSSSSGFSTTGTWTPVAGGYDGESLTAAGGSGATATWTFDVPKNEEEGVSLTWLASALNATNATYTINDGTTSFNETVDQTSPPNDNTGAAYDDPSNPTTPFQKVIDVTSATGVITVTLDASTLNGFAVSADAVAINTDSNPGGSGGGISQFDPAPAYQTGLTINDGGTTISSGGMRTTPDVSIVGGTGHEVLYVNSGTSLFAGTVGKFAGTSLSAPVWAGLIADVDQGRALSGLGALTGSTQTLPMLYSLPSYVFHQITVGFNGYEAGTGYNLVTGLGTPYAQLVAAGLGGVVASGGFNVSASSGTPVTSQTVATFYNPGGYTVHTDINWGDGSADTTGTIVGPGLDGLYQLEGTHTYAKQGLYKITVHISFGPSAGVTVTSTATVSYNIGILLLDPTGAGSLTNSGNGGISVTGSGDIVVDSNNGKAAIQSGSGTVSATVIDVTGGVSRTGSGGFVGPVQTETAYADPLATLAAPTPSGLTFHDISINSRTVTLSPGTYVGGIQISGSSKVTLLPGIYILQGGGLKVSGTSSLSGSGVMIYNAPATNADEISISGSSVVSLAAPTIGPYQGIVFFQNRASAAPIELASGNAKVTLTGVVYAPVTPVLVTGTSNILIQGDAANGISGALIAYDLNQSGSAELAVDSSANSAAGSMPALDV